MRLLFVIVLVLNLLVEGFAVLAIASASLWIWPWRTDLRAVTAVLGILLVFHTALFVSLATAGDQPVGMVIHGVLAALCLVAFARRSNWCVPESGLSTSGNST